MPGRQSLPYEYEATLEELNGIGRSKPFDDCIDDPDNSDIQVICRRPNPATKGEDDAFLDVPIAKPSRAFYFGDRNLYEQEAKRHGTDEKRRILNSDQFPGNERVFDELKRACNRGFVIPFVGAGMSSGAGLPGWRKYLLDKGEAGGLDREALKGRLDNGEYEEVMNDVVEALTIAVFERDFERDFTLPEEGEEIAGAVALLPELFDCTVVTTNFDRLLERVYSDAGKGFTEKCTGRGTTDAFFRAIPAGERHLLKLHGNIDNPAERILSRDEYDEAYGQDWNIDKNYPLPRVLDRLFSSYSLLFLGCSLAADRTIQTFLSVVGTRKAETLPRHYAVIPSPDEEDQRREIDQRLADANISPIWFPDSAFEHVEQILGLIKG